MKNTSLPKHVSNWHEEGAAHLSHIQAGRIRLAVSGMDTVLSLLYQELIDSDCSGDGRLVFNSHTKGGLMEAVEAMRSLVEVTLAEATQQRGAA